MFLSQFEIKGKSNRDANSTEKEESRGVGPLDGTAVHSSAGLPASLKVQIQISPAAELAQCACSSFKRRKKLALLYR